MHTHIIIHYGELALKGQNRKFFEHTLVGNIEKATDKKVERFWGRLVIKTADTLPTLRFIPGISHYSYCIRTLLDIEEIKSNIRKYAVNINKDNKFRTFKIATNRANKKFSLTSQEVNAELGRLIETELNVTVDLDQPEVTFYIEIADSAVYLSSERLPGVGGLPVGVTGKVISLISGGIDSPVASFFMNKRGCRVVYCHFHHHGKTGSKSKVKKLVGILGQFQCNSKLYLVKFRDIQNEIIKVIPSKYRMIVYRRVMLKIAEIILLKEGAYGFVTGDSLAQVASQTLENLNVIHSGSRYPILSPLIGLDKIEITAIARKIGTFDTSIIPHEDCCSYLIDRHPETKARLNHILKLEKNLNIDLMDIKSIFEIIKY